MPTNNAPFLLPEGNQLINATTEDYRRALAAASPEDRRALKELNFAVMYGMNPQKIGWSSYADSSPLSAEYPSDVEKRALRALKRSNRRLGSLDELV